MKRVVMIAILMVVITSLFSFSVLAAPVAGYSTSTNISSDDNNITAYMYAVYNEHYVYNSSSGLEISVPYLNISIRVVNNTNKWVIKDTDQIKVRINGITSVGSEQEIFDITGASIVETTHSTGYSDITLKADNNFVLAPNETYTITLNFSSLAGFTTTPSVQFWNNQFVNTDYDIDELVSLPADDLAYLSDLNEELGNLIDVLVYGGTPVTNINLPNYFKESDTYPLNNIRLLVRAYWGKPYYQASNIYVDTNTDTATDLGSVVYPLYLRIYVRNNNSYTLITRSLGRISDLLAYNNSFYVDYFNSTLFSGFNVDNRSLELFFGIPYSDGRSVVPVGEYNTTMIAHYVVPAGQTISVPNAISVTGFFQNTGTTTEYYPSNIYTIIRDIYFAVNNQDTANDPTETAEDMNDEIHEQEQIWYDNNSSALESVGLSNYRFSQSQTSGITQAVTQFQAVWNALGDWTLVYIFILILSVATYIIKHEPTTRVKQYRSSVAAERAERISYYGKKNAESRASSSGGSTLKNAIRRRK